ncbi:MAG: hypothetical protein ACFB22_14240 [Rhodothalassiaceae bacterium]
MTRRRAVFLFLFASTLLAADVVAASTQPAAQPSPAVTVRRVRPVTVYAEQRFMETRLNFDLELSNGLDRPVSLTYLELRAFAPNGDFLTRAQIGSNGLPGPLADLPQRRIPAGGTLYLFNPFPDLPVANHIARVGVRLFHTGGIASVTLQLEKPPGPSLSRPPLDVRS